MQDKLAFFHILEELKTQKRTGWINHKVGIACLPIHCSHVPPDPESGKASRP